MRKSKLTALTACTLLTFMTACGAAGGNAVSEGPQAVSGSLAAIENQAVPLYSKPAAGNVRIPQASGKVTYGNNLVTLDASNSGQGYAMMKYTGSNKKIKVQISKTGSETYTYDLNARNGYEVFPFTEGNGSYTVKVFENLQGNQYTQAFSQTVNVTLSDQFLPFLYPNQYVNFTPDSKVVAQGVKLASKATDQIGVVSGIFNYVVDHITYDNEKANNVVSGYLPDIDRVLEQKKGICFDYAAVMTAMLRSQDIPTKLIVGYTGDIYHAWVNVYIEGQGWIDQMIYFDGQDWNLLDPTFMSSSNKSTEIVEYMKNPANYKAKYSY